MSADGSNMSADWSHLPPQLISLIFEKVADSNINNISNCAGVCVSWRSVRDQLVNNFSPTILVQDRRRHERDENGCFINSNQGHYRIFNTGTRETQDIMLPELCGKFFRSVWPGWLLASNYESPNQVSFLHTLTRAQIRLPLLWRDEKDHGNFIVVPSSNPSDSKCIFLGAYPFRDNIKGLCRPGDNTWSLTTMNYLGNCLWIYQAIYFKGDFYITGYDHYPAYVYRVQIDENNMTPKVERLLHLPKHSDKESYLVELMGELLLISIYLHDCVSKEGTDTKMKVHKLELNGDNNRWVRVRSFGGKHAIYACHLRAMAIYVGESNSRAECQPNCVYILENRRIRSAVFDVETGCSKNLCGFPSWTYLLNWFRF